MSDYKPSILMVDDEPQILRVMRASLPPRGYNLRVASNGLEALKMVEQQMPDLIILDLVMPSISGLDVCKEIRKTSNVPIIILSAKNLTLDKIATLELGADDYLTKPFDMGELLARIRALLRRTNKEKEQDSTIVAGDITINTTARQVLVNGKEVRLTPKEFEVLKYLMNNANQVIKRQALLQAVWGSSSPDQYGSLRVSINQLRRKIELDPENPRYILTEPWIGYKFCG
jgi:two-component system KDP operon response regulator KdpE